MKTKPDIRPTGKCFDDSLGILVDIVSQAKDIRTLIDYRLVHGICLDSLTDKPIAHAWIERGAWAIFTGLNERDERVVMVGAATDYRRELRVQDAMTYTVEEAWAENRRTGHYGPWIDRYRALCAPKRRLELVKGVS